MSWTYPKKEKRQRNSNESIRRGQEVPHPLTLTHQSVANKTSLVKELTNPLKLPAFPTIWYKNRSPPSLWVLSTWPLGCVEGVPARACNKVPHPSAAPVVFGGIPRSGYNNRCHESLNATNMVLAFLTCEVQMLPVYQNIIWKCDGLNFFHIYWVLWSLNELSFVCRRCLPVSVWRGSIFTGVSFCKFVACPLLKLSSLH